MNFEEPRRFWSKVDVRGLDECWEWLASKFHSGYGQFGINYKLWYAHRAAWVLTFGPIPEGLCVCHHCDNPGCCNPYHLFLGTHADNMTDSAKKGHKAMKLTQEEVLEIRELLRSGWSQRKIVRELGINQSTVSRINQGWIWGWL